MRVWVDTVTQGMIFDSESIPSFVNFPLWACMFDSPTFYYSAFHRENDIIYLQDFYEDYMRSVLLT